MSIDRRQLFTAALGAAISGRAFAQTPAPDAATPQARAVPRPDETIDLWPDGAPGMPQQAPEEAVVERSADPSKPDRSVSGISRPRLVAFRPADPNGAAVVLTPGGGYQRIVIDKEGYELAPWLAARGITAFVLFYRLPGEGWAAGPDVALSDAQRAMRLVRSRAEDFGIDPERIAAMGFSAGGHLCADLGTRFAAPTYESVDDADLLSARPALAAPIYPVVSMSLPVAHAGSRQLLVGANASTALEAAHSPHLNVPDDAPPFFLVHAEDDGAVDVENTLLLRAALRAKHIPVETHLFESGGHGFGLNRAAGKPAAIWPELFHNWAGAKGLV